MKCTLNAVVLVRLCPCWHQCLLALGFIAIPGAVQFARRVDSDGGSFVSLRAGHTRRILACEATRRESLLRTVPEMWAVPRSTARMLGVSSLRKISVHEAFWIRTRTGLGRHLVIIGPFYGRCPPQAGRILCSAAARVLTEHGRTHIYKFELGSAYPSALHAGEDSSLLCGPVATSRPFAERNLVQ